MTKTSKATINRRQFIYTGTAAAGGLHLLGGPADTIAAQATDATEVVRGKNSKLTVHTSDTPVLETPSQLLSDQITPLDAVFVRNNQPYQGAATLSPRSLASWRIKLSGLINKPVTIDGSTLQDMKQVEHEMVLQCCGNGRSLFAGSVKAKGTQWTRGGMANVKFRGVPLKDVLTRLQVDINKQASYLTAEGRDAPTPDKEDFEHSLPLGAAVRQSILALSMNGQPLPAIHGGPVRLVTPGFYGTMHIKWVTGLRFESTETDNHNHIPRYRVPRRPIKPGSAIKYTFRNSRPSWRMKLKSVVLSPEPAAQLPAGRKTTIRGVAFNDGKARIDSVLLSVDGGVSWTRTKLEVPKSRYAWYRWSHQLTLAAGSHQIWTRAVDSLGRSQPLDGSIHWNPSGYEWNGVEKISVRVS